MSLRIFVPSALLFLGVVPACIAANAGQETFAPPVYGIQRYEAIWKRSPFIKETIVNTGAAGLATKFSVQAIAYIGKDPMVVLQEIGKDPLKNRYMIVKGRSDNTNNPEHIELVSANLDPDPRRSTVDIRQGSQTATLHFDTAVVAPPSTAGGVMPGTVPGVVPGAVPGIPPGAGMIPPQAGIPSPQVALPPAANTSAPSVVPQPGIPPVGAPQQVGSNVPPLGLPTPPTAPRRIIRPAAVNMNN